MYAVSGKPRLLMGTMITSSTGANITYVKTSSCQGLWCIDIGIWEQCCVGA